jgi:hypothetical protein
MIVSATLIVTLAAAAAILASFAARKAPFGGPGGHSAPPEPPPPPTGVGSDEIWFAVDKAAGVLFVMKGASPVETMPASTGRFPGDKEREGDCRTPVGTFRVVVKNPESKFHLSLGLSYPDPEDAQRGLASGLITRDQYDAVIAADEGGAPPPWDTPLGGEIFIHGGGPRPEGTAGCVAVSNADVRRLFDMASVGTLVVITP